MSLLRLMWIFIVGLIVQSCQRTEHSQKPSEVLAPYDMQEVLMELYLTEEKVKEIELAPDSSQILFDTLKGRIFRDRNISDSLFKKSMDYYWEHDEEVLKIYNALVDSLNLGQQVKRK